MRRILLIIALAVSACAMAQKSENIIKLEKQLQRQAVARNAFFATASASAFSAGLYYTAKSREAKQTMKYVSIASGAASILSAFVWCDAQMKINKTVTAELRGNSLTIKF